MGRYLTVRKHARGASWPEPACCWADLAPSELGVRYEHAHPGDKLHMDTKKLGRIVPWAIASSGIPGDSVDGAGWESLFVAIPEGSPP